MGSLKESKRLPWMKKLAFALLPLVILFLSVEISLRFAKFEYLTIPRYLQFGYEGGIPESVSADTAQTQTYQEDKEPVFRPSSETFWEPIPGRYRFHEQGFIGDVIQGKRSDKVLRIAALGDSCTMYGEPSYPELIGKVIEKQRDIAVEVVNAGVAGYSTHQGLLRWQKHIKKLSPDIVFISFAWNDHWLAMFRSDHEQRPPRPLELKLQNFLEWFRVFQLLNQLVVTFRSYPMSLPFSKKEISLVKYRVPLEKYKNNLTAIVKDIQASGAMPILLTAPSAMTLGPPKYLITVRLALDLDNLEALHQTYNDAMKEVANETRTKVIDVAAKFPKENLDHFFLSDRIHFTKLGIAIFSKIVTDELKSTTL